MPINKGTGLGFELSMVVNSVAYITMVNEILVHVLRLSV